MTILEIENISKIYATKESFFREKGKKIIALEEFSLEIEKGEIFGLVGESGSGKTTAGRLIVKLEEPNTGKIVMNKEEITHLSGKALKNFRRKVQMVFQDPYQSLNPQRSIYDTVSEPLSIHRIGQSEERRELVREALKSVGLSPPDDFINRYPHQLSGGQRQRVAIARAMVLKPEFVVADEPTSMLDASISAQIFNILLDMRNSKGVTLLFITHSLAAARYLCDRIAVIYRGNLMEMGPGDEVIQNPKHPYTKALLDALPRFGDCGVVKRYNTLRDAQGQTFGQVGCPFFPRCGVAHRIRCSGEKPKLKEINPSHKVACFYAEPGVSTDSANESCFYTP